MKTFDTFGALPARHAVSSENGASATAVALRIQRALGVNLLADETMAYSQYSSRALPTRGMTALLVSGNLDEPGDPAPLPEFDYAVVVNVDEPVDPADTQATLEAIGLKLLRRRRREYALSSSSTTRPSLQLYGTSGDAARTVATLSRVLDMSFDGNQHASGGGDSHYYGESEQSGAILVFENTPRPFDGLPFPQHADHASVVIVVNPPDRDHLQRRLVDAELVLLKDTESGQPT